MELRYFCAPPPPLLTLFPMFDGMKTGAVAAAFCMISEDRLLTLRGVVGSSDADEARELPSSSCDSRRTGDALRRIVSSINCFA